jgi:hypothetical protein
VAVAVAQNHNLEPTKLENLVVLEVVHQETLTYLLVALEPLTKALLVAVQIQVVIPTAVVEVVLALLDKAHKTLEVVALLVMAVRVFPRQLLVHPYPVQEVAVVVH